MTFKKFTCSLYNAEVWFLTGNHLDCKKVLEQKLNADIEHWEHSNSQGFTEIYDDPHVFVVWVKKKNDICTILHECVHLAIEILNDRGIKFSETENGEILAYYIENWFKILTGKNTNDK